MDIEESETAKKGLNKAMSNEDLKRVAEYLRAKGATATMVNLKKSPDEPDACVLFIKNGINWIGADREKVFDEMRSLGKDGMDTRYYNSRRKMVQNKLARWNFNAGDRHQDADIPNGKNTSARFLLKHDKELARRDARKDAKKRKKQLTLESFVKRKKTCEKHDIIPVRGEMGDHTTYECRYCDYTSGCV